MANYVAGIGPIGAKIAICGEAPGAHEDRAGLPFVGPSGDMLDEFLDSIKLRRKEVYLTNICKFRPPNNDLNKLGLINIDLDEQGKRTRDELASIKPNVVIALGNTALRYLTGKNKITKYRGSILTMLGGFPKVVATFHPAHLLRGYSEEGMQKETAEPWAKFVARADFQRALEESSSPRLDLPQRYTQIARSSSDVIQFFKSQQHENILAIDIEVIKTIPICVGLSLNPAWSLTVPLLQKFNGVELSKFFSISDLAYTWQILGREFANPKWKKVGQNFKFDQDKLDRMGFKIDKLYADVMLMLHTLYPELPKSLAFAASIWTREPFWKDEGKDFNPKKDNIEDYYKYNGKDACVTRELVPVLLSELEECNLSEFYHGYINHLHSLYLSIEREGITQDQEQREKLRKKYKDMLFEIDSKLFEKVGFQFNPNSPQQVALVLFKHFGLPFRKGTGEDELTAILANVPKARKDPIKSALEYILLHRQIAKTLGTYINANPDYDGRMRTNFKIYGTETGRTSTTILKAPLRPTEHKIGQAFQTLTKHSEVGSDLASMYVADPGWLIIGADYSQAEPRIVALLAEDYNLLKAFDDKKNDIHSMTGSWFFDIRDDSWRDWKKNKDPRRFVGKTGRNGGNYDMGKRRLMQTINTDARKYKINISMSEWRAGQIIETFHRYTPNIRKVYHAQVREAIDRTRVLTNPFGRPKTFYGDLGEGSMTYKEAYAQIPQSTVGDAIKKSMLRMRQEDSEIRIVLEWHDAIYFLVPEKEYEAYGRMIKRCMNVPINFKQCTLSRDFDLLIPVEMEVGDRLSDLKEFHAMD